LRHGHNFHDRKIFFSSGDHPGGGLGEGLEVGFGFNGNNAEHFRR
jgi:hypothetical protein